MIKEEPFLRVNTLKIPRSTSVATIKVRTTTYRKSSDLDTQLKHCDGE